MLDLAVDVLRRTVSPVSSAARVVDRGGGTGGLAHRVLAALPEAKVHLVDVDAAMLARAKERLAAFGDRATFARASFDDPLPASDAVVASLSLHHVRAF